MNEKFQTPTSPPLPPLLPTAPLGINTEDYRYETQQQSVYVTQSSSAKANEATSSGLYRYASAGSLSGALPSTGSGGGAYHVTAVSAEFGGTLKSSKGSGSSPRKREIRKGGGGSHANCCSCFGGSGAGGRAKVSFWPAVLANIGICALLVGYIFIGSFVFLTIENSATPEDVVGRRGHHVNDAASTWNFAQKPQTSTKTMQQQENEQQPLMASTFSDQTHKDNATARTTGIQQQQQQPHAASVAIASAAADAEAHIDNMSAGKDKPWLRQDHNDYEQLQTLSAEEVLDGEQRQQDESMVVDATEYAARQRTVENIWEITVSLNILYKENWTKLAALEIQRYQDQLVKRLAMDLTLSTGATRDNSPTSAHKNAVQHNGRHQQQQHRNHYPQLQAGRVQRRRMESQPFEWTFASAFLYSLTVITTVGYGSISPRTTLGRMVTIGYATLGIPLTLIYLSSIGGILAKLARLLCTRALCCCFCARRRHHNYCCCCYNAALHAPPAMERELRLKRLRLQQQQESIKMRAQQQQQHLAYCYVRPPASSTNAAVTADDMREASLDTLSVATSATTTATHSATNAFFGWSLVAPIALCLLLMLFYVAFGACALTLLEADWTLLDGVYFCFMSLTTIGFCDLLPGVATRVDGKTRAFAVWFCAVYILCGLTLTAMCVNVLHEEILLRMRVVVKFKKVAATKETKDRAFYATPPPP